jgi:CheY-like chemotaxis protein
LQFELIRDLLERHDHTAESAHDGERVLELARRHRFDLLVLDLHLPKRDGLWVLHELRRDPATRDYRVLAVSADVMPAVRQEAEAIGVEGFLVKPLELEEFSRLVEAIGRG